MGERRDEFPLSIITLITTEEVFLGELKGEERRCIFFKEGKGLGEEIGR